MGLVRSLLAVVRYQFEAFVALDELLPSIAIMMLTIKSRGNRSEAEPSEATGFMVSGTCRGLSGCPQPNDIDASFTVSRLA